MKGRPSISAFLSFLIAAVALSGLLVYATSLALFARTESMHADDEAERLGAVITSSVRAVLREPETVLEVAASVLESSRCDLETSLATLQGACGYYRLIMYLDADGIVRAVAPPSTVYAGADYSSAPFLSDFRASGSIRWSSIYAGLEEGSREISVSLSTEDGAILGILDFDTLSERLSEVLGDSAPGLSLADSGGTLIVHKDLARVNRRESDPDLLQLRLADPDAAEYRFRRGTGRNDPLVLARRIPETGWFAIVERPMEFALEAFRDSVPLVSIIAALIIGSSAGLAAVATRLLLRDVKAAGMEAENPETGRPGSERPTDAGRSSMYFRETAAILSAARAAAERIRAKEEANQRLNALNARLEKTLAELADAQSALVESEREAVRGMMAAAMAHELNTPIAAAVSAAGEAETAALDVLGHAVRDASHDAGSGALAERLLAAARAWVPESAPIGMDRRKLSREAEVVIAEALRQNELPAGGAVAAGTDEARLPGAETGRIIDLDPAIIAERLVDLGISSAEPHALELVCRSLTSEPARTLSLLETAEIVVSCRVIRSGMLKAHSVVSTIKEYSAAEEPGRRLPVRVGVSIEGAIALLYTRTKKGVELQADIDGGLWIDADPGVLQRIWMSLLTNALDAIGYRGRIGIAAYRDGDSAVIRFEDSGPVMPPDLLTEVWKAESGQRLRDVRGGASLYSVSQLVGMSGGSVSCSTDSGRTAFCVRFPAAATPA